MFDLFYRQPRLLALALALILVSGFSALHVLPRYEDPELTSRNALILTPYPGADAERVETQVTEKLEAELATIEEIHLIESTSRTGISTISVEVADAITETDAIWSEVRDHVADAALSLPEGAHDPSFEELEISAWSFHVGLVWQLEDEPNHAVLGRLAEELEDELRAVPGTQDVEIFGAPEEEIRVTVDPSRIATLGLTAEGLARELQRADSKVPSGRLDTGRNDLLLEVAGELDDLERIRQVPVLNGRGGRLVRVGEIASVERTVVDPPTEIALVDQRPAVLVGVRMRSGERVDRWSERVRAQLDPFEALLPQGVALDVVFDQSTYTEERLDGLGANLALGAALVFAVIFFSMGWRSALLVGSALPLSALMVVSGMRLFDIPMHQMSITGLIIALGLLIDNAIVMVDEVNHRLSEGRGITRAVGAATRSLAVPLGASTLTTVLAFLPLVLAEGPVGEFVGALSVSVMLAVISSFLLAMTVVPALTGWMARIGKRKGASESWLDRGVGNRRLTALYARGLHALFARPALAVVLALALPIFGFWKGSELQEQFFPPAGRDQASIELTLPPLASIGRTLDEVQRVDALLREHPSVRSTSWTVGRSAPKFYYNQLELVEGASNHAGGLIQLDSAEGAIEVMRELQSSLDEALPSSRALVRQLEQGPPFEAPIELILRGPALDVLHERGEALRALVSSVPDVLHTRARLSVGRPKLLFSPTEEDVERSGLDRVGVAERLQTALSGALGGSVFEGLEELPVRVRVHADERDETDEIAALELSNSSGGWVPLDALGTLELVPEASSIPRRNNGRTNEIHAHITAGTLPQDALDAVQAKLASFALPAGYELIVGGESAERDDAVGSLAASVGVLVVLMVSTLVMSFQSFRLAGIIGGVAFLSVGLALGALWAFGLPFGFMAIVGSMGLIGIAINDGIVVLAALREDPEARAGQLDAVVKVVVRSTRHVLSTTVTTVAGFTPLLLEGEGLWPPLAVSIAGGVLGATLLALIFVPGVLRLMVGAPKARAHAARRVELPQPGVATT